MLRCERKMEQVILEGRERTDEKKVTANCERNSRLYDKLGCVKYLKYLYYPQVN